MKIKIQCQGETKEGETITKTYTSHVSTTRGQNKAIEYRHKQFWNNFPDIVSSNARIISECVFT